MDLFDVLDLIGGLCLFLFGMNLMGSALEKRAGSSLTALLGKMTTGKMAGFLTGAGVTAIIQSSSATTVMVVGFVNSGVMSLKQAINVIMGANVGTTVTAWLLSLSGIESSNTFVQLLKPSSFTPVLALIGIVLYMMPNSDNRKKDTATILLGFSTLMFGMETMSAAVAGLKEVEGFRSILTMFSNPVLGVLAGAVLTAVIQSSSASVGILQALSSTGQITVGASIPIIMGQNIGTCVTAMLSSIGTNRNARRTSAVHLSFNVIGTAILLVLFVAGQAIFDLGALTDTAANQSTIALCHTVFNLLCTAILLPASGLLEKLSYKLIPEPEAKAEEKTVALDERLMATPSVALDRCRVVTGEMADISVHALLNAIVLYDNYTEEAAAEIRRMEDQADYYEDILGSYLVKLGTYPLSDEDNHEAAKLLHLIGDLERISDHAVGVLKTVEELRRKGIRFSDEGLRELKVIFSAVEDTLALTAAAYVNNDMDSALRVEALKQVTDMLKNHLRSQHIARMQKGLCTIEAGFIWSDLLTNLGRAVDHCSNIAGCVMEMSHSRLDLHDYSRVMRETNQEYADTCRGYAEKYLGALE